MKAKETQRQERLTEDRVRELAGDVLSEQEIQVCVASIKLTEAEIILAARYKARRAKEEMERLRGRTDPMMQERISSLFRGLTQSI